MDTIDWAATMWAILTLYVAALYIIVGGIVYMAFEPKATKHHMAVFIASVMFWPVRLLTVGIKCLKNRANQWK